MKIIGFEIRKFNKEPETIEALETWIVKWEYSKGNYLPNRNEIGLKHLAFASKGQAESYAKELKNARRLLGDIDLNVKVYKQEVPTNV